MNKKVEMNEWNPEQYLQFKSERTQPAIDLVSRINIAKPQSIIDIGCGPGNSTQILVNRWPNSEVVGLDNSITMIEKARQDYPDQKWIVGNAENIDPDSKYDLIFSNATLQWIPHHEILLPKLFNCVNPGGAVAVQIPKFKNMPINVAIETVANSDNWINYTKGCEELFTLKDMGFYYEIISKFATRVELWESSYFHILNSRESVIDFVRTTGLKPYLDRLPSDEMKSEFEREVLTECKKYYKVQSNGKVLFPFERLFFIGYK
ncbi:MAG: methyltransferase domain-containing protein [Candidatus Methanoperedens sp.]|nr:methyltransferase domain-containing protein [Candidatus Methanoperedens sp.]MCZ7404123.1 methyltransferase domain-containing protein [Candidatus Methanoperedens sp.]